MSLTIEKPKIDVEFTVGEGTEPERDFATAVHLALFWGLDGGKSDACPSLAVSPRIADLLRRGIPPSADEIERHGAGGWPPSAEALDLTRLPSAVEGLMSGRHTVSWRLEAKRLALAISSLVEKGDQTYDYVGRLDLLWDDKVRVRQRVAHVTECQTAADVPRSLKMIASACGLFDGSIRLQPYTSIIDNVDDAAVFADVVRNPERQQPVVAVTALAGGEATWMETVEEHAKQAFTLQHVYAVTLRGTDAICEVLEHHGLTPGCLKTYYADFHDRDHVNRHRLQTSSAIAERPNGLKGMLKRWRHRMAVHDANERAERQERFLRPFM